MHEICASHCALASWATRFLDASYTRVVTLQICLPTAEAKLNPKARQWHVTSLVRAMTSLLVSPAGVMPDAVRRGNMKPATLERIQQEGCSASYVGDLSYAMTAYDAPMKCLLSPEAQPVEELPVGGIRVALHLEGLHEKE